MQTNKLTYSILQRMRELSVQAANDTYTLSDRIANQKEMVQLTTEIDRIASHTEFNNKIYPLLGAGSGMKNILSKIFTNHSVTFTATNPIVVDKVAYNPGDKVTVTGVITNYVSNGKLLRVFLGNNFFPEPKEPFNLNEIEKKFIEINDRTNNGGGWSLRVDDFKVDENGGIYYPLKITSSTGNVYTNDIYVQLYYTPTSGRIHSWGTRDKNDPHIMKINSFASDASTNAHSQIWIQAGANANQIINLSLVDATAAGIGLNEISVLSGTEAGKSIQTIDNAIARISHYRNSFGAGQNRLEHMMSVNNNTAENLQFSESKIRDVKMSDEVLEYIKRNILSKTGTSILAQANQNAEGVLSLLQ